MVYTSYGSLGLIPSTIASYGNVVSLYGGYLSL